MAPCTVLECIVFPATKARFVYVVMANKYGEYFRCCENDFFLALSFKTQAFHNTIDCLNYIRKNLQNFVRTEGGHLAIG